jgi:hypothetical protein
VLVALLVHEGELLLQFRAAVFVQAAIAAPALLVRDVEQAITLGVVRVALGPIAGHPRMGIPGIAARILTADWRVGHAAAVPFAAHGIVIHVCLLMLLDAVAGAMLVVDRHLHDSTAFVAPCAAICVDARLPFVDVSAMPVRMTG